MSIKEVSWKKQNKLLDNDAENNVQLKKEINKQSDMDSIVQNSINDKIYDLKQEAITLTKKVENQKYKNLQLQTIINTMRIRMDDQRKVEASYVTDSNFQNIQSLERKIKKFEYDLEQINTRTNKTNSVVSDKKHKISLLRTQRVIDSSIFRNIEKELIGSEMEFKKLLIEKVRHERIYQACLNEYSLLKAKAIQHFQSQQTQQKSTSASRQNTAQEGYSLQASKQTNDKNKFKQIQRNVTSYKKTFTQSDSKKDQQSSNYEFAVKKLLMNLNLSSGKQFVYSMYNIQNINDQYFTNLNKTGDEIGQLEQEIKNLQNSIVQNTLKFYKPKHDLTKTQIESIKCQKIKFEAERTKDQAQKEIQSLVQFMGTKNFAQFAQFLDLSDKMTPNMDIQSLLQLLKSIQENMGLLNYHQAPKLTERSFLLKTERTQKQKREEKLQDVMNRVKFNQENNKIMKKQDFKEEYRKMMESGPAIASKQQLLKKKTRKVLP